MRKYDCMIIDDEPHSVEGLKKYIEFVPTLKLVKAYIDPVEALLELSGVEKVDLILMDIDMPKINGIELSKQLREKTKKLIFTTAYTQYGYDAFEVSADAYLLKPYSLSKFAGTIAKIFPPADEKENSHYEDDYFFVKNKEENHRLIKVKYRDVAAVESKQNYVMIHTPEKKILTYMSLTEIGNILERFPDFVKYHRSFVINKQHISSIAGNTLTMCTGLQITVGEYFRKDFVSFLEKRLIKSTRRP